MRPRETQSYSPHWPLGAVGRFFVKKSPARGDDHGLMAVEQLPVLNVRRIDTGFVILAGTQGEYLFEVDANGESAECVPWDDEMEREFQLHGEDIPPTYDMPNPDLEPPESPQVAEVLQPVGIITQPDPGLYNPGTASQEYLVPVTSEELPDQESRRQRAAEALAQQEAEK